MSQSPQVGKTLRNRYKTIQLLGSGGFGDTFLAIDLDFPGQPQCVVKHLKPKSSNPAILPMAKSLFEEEARNLDKLSQVCNQIPRLFAHFEENEEFYLVQEFIDGHDLSIEITPGKQWSEDTVVKLLQDILEVLSVVHQHDRIHRDIKPQNLMRRRSDGTIVLIDFGAVKEVSVLEVDAFGHTNTTMAIGTPGYMPSEQSNGHPKLCSDVYAVGMIGIFALTGVPPAKLPRNSNTEEVIWRDRTRVSSALADVLDTMVRYDFSKRYLSAAAAMQALVSTPVSSPQLAVVSHNDATVPTRPPVSVPATQPPPTDKEDSPRPLQRRKSGLAGVMLASLAIAATLVGVRHAGLLQAWELSTFDHMLQLRSAIRPEKPDDRILVVEITDADVAAQKEHGELLGDKSLSDASLKKLLDVLEPHQPLAVGLDLYRDSQGVSTQVVNRLNQMQNLIGVCKSQSEKYDPHGFAPPQGIPNERLGFSDAVPDPPDDVLRRQILFMTQESGSSCQASYAFNVELAFRYLNAVKGIIPEFTPDNYLKLGKTVFTPLNAASGGYQPQNLGGNQILLNYRAANVPSVKLTQVLQGQFNPSAIKNRIVLIGVNRQASGDKWVTPYTKGEKTPGVFVQAQMLSQILSAVLDGRPLLWAWSWWGEILWISSWSLGGGLLVWRLRTPLYRVFGLSLAAIALYCVCFGIFTQGVWVPLVPPVLALALIGGGAVVYQIVSTTAN